MNIAEEPIFGMHLGTEADPKIDPIQDSIDKTFPHPEYFSYLIGVKSESGVSDNPYGVLETLLGGVQRTINMEQKMSEVLLEESIPLIIKEIELEKDIQAVDLGSIESGIIPTYGSYD
ncbi:MAG TPA: hypothetical protein VLG12_08135, partial [Candidatus Saccharimonadales bacterium]|nr:hypothetical protein [Candidatus Saccharimonadales bacterium]